MVRGVDTAGGIHHDATTTKNTRKMTAVAGVSKTGKPNYVFLVRGGYVKMAGMESKKEPGASHLSKKHHSVLSR